MTQEQAAQALGVNAQTISRWECSTTLPDVAMLPQIARLYCVSIDDLYKETSVAYDNYAQRLGSIYEASLEPEDFVRADQEYRRMLKSSVYTTEDLRLYGILHQHMLYYCAERAAALYDRVLDRGPEEDPEVYWRTRRQKIFFLYEIGRNDESIQEFFAAVSAGSRDINEWVCLIYAYQFAGQDQTAWEWIQRAEQIFPENPMLCCCAGGACEAMGRYDEAFAYWDKTLELDPSFTDAMYAKAECYEQLGDYQKAYGVWTVLADDLERRGFDSEQILPRQMAKKCKERIQKNPPLY